ncbi:phage tail protein [Streptomyces filamentosus]|uniref:phage tail protein n=1 Tax=Streptomyces filamentosus TaxID=67294 RepID=UPI0012388ED6|nr:phage tail protein [Streptomyces filamentosus]KAA6210395.1 phage tail protein [Streptomyces filamentosus]
MRTDVPGLPSPHPLAELLPAVYLEHDFLTRFLAALDEVLAPVLLSLDNLPAHLDPRTAPEDFLDWLAGWVAVEPRDDGPPERRRAAVLGAVDRHRARGTLRGLAEALRLETGGARVRITESGGTVWSPTPGTPLPGTRRPWVTVRLEAPDPGRADRARLEELIAAEVPAHVGFTLELLSGGAP